MIPPVTGSGHSNYASAANFALLNPLRSNSSSRLSRRTIGVWTRPMVSVSILDRHISAYPS